MTKIIEDFRNMKRTFAESILNMNPVDLAYYFVRGASDTEKMLIREVLNSASTHYREEVTPYTENPYLFETSPELRKRFSGVEDRIE